MTAAFVFYLYCSLKNRIRTRVQRLRQPRYLISLVAGLLYLYLVFFRQFLSRDGMRVLRNPSARAEPDLLPLMETGFALLLLGIVLLPWIFPRRNPGISFTEAEIQFLFPAPITRRALLHFRLVKSQLAILFGVLISFLIFGRGRSFSHPFYFLVDLWMVYSFLAFYRMGTALVQTSLAEHGATGIRRHLWVLVLVAGAVFSVFVWLRWFVPSLPPRKGLTPESIVAWISELAWSGPAFYILLPFRALVRPALAPEPVSFLLSLIPALLLVLLCYAWVLRSDVSFEEASLERAERMARRIEAARKGGPLLFAAARVRRPPFDLAPGGPAFLAIFWKNLIGAGRFGFGRVLSVVLIAATGVLFSLVSVSAPNREMLAVVVGSAAVGIASFLVVFGPVVQRDDLRVDLLYVDLIKTYPLPGWAVVLGEILTPALILTGQQCGLVLVALSVLPPVDEYLSSLYQRAMYALGAFILIPCLSLIGVLTQNAAALLVPGWVALGKAQPQGIEAMGQRMITMIASLVVLLFAVIPGAAVFGFAFLTGYWLLGPAMVPLAALPAAAGLLLEAAVIVAWLGRLFEKFDASLELRETD